MLLHINVFMPACDILQKPVSYVAAYVQKYIKEYGTREQMEAFGAIVRESSSKLPPFFGGPWYAHGDALKLDKGEAL